MPRDVPSEGRSWLLQRRTTLSHRQLQKLFVILCAPSLLVALSFLYLGYWYILAYSLLELTVLGLCMRHHARHAGDYDRIDITPFLIMIEQRRAEVLRRVKLNPRTTRLLPLPHDRAPVRLQDQHGQAVLAEFLNAAQRRELARDLASCLHPRQP
ncbi:DUF2244 domain-containing protein [Duganella callida]|uniref:DUF2244 domain-containing protein n=1 Tax=Duganella callida TaxID=2561932 RepID=A0A4Y9SMZ9_9BURK|nr:DUF2244 domain-containing protein [Duganella callida]TFW27918.1 DUF2244 domain-containing protein [Duganella callida]